MHTHFHHNPSVYRFIKVVVQIWIFRKWINIHTFYWRSKLNSWLVWNSAYSSSTIDRVGLGITRSHSTHAWRFMRADTRLTLRSCNALRWGAGYVASPCCVGRILFAVAGAPDDYTPESLRTARVTKDGYVFPNLNVDRCLTYPRSRWLRSVITRDEFLLLARTADWSSYEYESWTSRLHSLCKIMVELDRNLASEEAGYQTSLLSLADQKAGAVGVSHILVGEPSLSSILQV